MTWTLKSKAEPNNNSRGQPDKDRHKVHHWQKVIIQIFLTKYFSPLPPLPIWWRHVTRIKLFLTFLSILRSLICQLPREFGAICTMHYSRDNRGIACSINAKFFLCFGIMSVTWLSRSTVVVCFTPGNIHSLTSQKIVLQLCLTPNSHKKCLQCVCRAFV